MDEVQTALQAVSKSTVDKDRAFNDNDPDYSRALKGISLLNFSKVFGPWVRQCHINTPHAVGDVDQDTLVRFLFLLSLYVRRLLRGFRQGDSDSFMSSFLKVFVAIPLPQRDSDKWIATCPGLLAEALQRGVQMALRLHQDYFTDPDEAEDVDSLWDSLNDYIGDGPLQQASR